MLVETERDDLRLIRRTQRVLARIRLNVSGKNNDKTSFEEESFTIAVSAGGGLLQMRKAVQKGQCLSLLQVKTGQQAVCTVANVETIEGGFAAVRVLFVEPQPEFWHIVFPPADWTPRHADSKFKKRPLQQNAMPASA